MNQSWHEGRRRFLQQAAFATAAFATPGLFAEELKQTAKLTEGPFYPDKLPLDTDNDLLVINENITPAVGEITHLSGQILSKTGSPIRNAFVEIWQVDSNGSYIHSDSANRNKFDKNFQGYGRFLTDAKGNYYFRTIKPVTYPGRTPHIHIAVSKNGKRIFTSQILVKGEARNERDGVFRRLREQTDRDTILADFKPIKDSKFGELAADFNVVLGHTAQELDGDMKGGIGKPQWRRRS